MNSKILKGNLDPIKSSKTTPTIQSTSNATSLNAVIHKKAWNFKCLSKQDLIQDFNAI